MTTFANDLDHAVYTRDESGKSVKLGARSAGVFTGVAADNFAEMCDQGYVRKLEGDEAKKVLAAQRADSIDPTVTAEGALPQTIAEAIGKIGQLTVSAPLQVVVGDDSAPYGPGSGTVTTKQALATADPGGIDRRQFAEGEVLVTDPKLGELPVVGGSERNSVGEVHEAQRQATAGVEQSIADLGLAGAETAPLDVDEDDEDGDGDEFTGMPYAELRKRSKEAELDVPGNASGETLRSALRAHAAKE